jgi:hypothetical protein
VVHGIKFQFRLRTTDQGYFANRRSGQKNVTPLAAIPFPRRKNAIVEISCKIIAPWQTRFIPLVSTDSFVSCVAARCGASRPATASVGWLIIQFATTVLPVLALPLWTARLVIVLVLAGFPIALILAWAFDVTSHGIEKTSDAPVDCPPSFPTRRKNIIPLAVFGLVIAIGAGYFGNKS